MGSSQDPGQALPVGSPDAGDAEEAHALASSLVPEQARQQTFVRARPSARQRRRRKAAKQSSPAQTLIPAAAVVLLGALLYRKLFAGRKQRREAEPEGPDYSHLLEPCEITSSEEHSEGSTLPLLGLRLAVSPLLDVEGQPSAGPSSEPASSTAPVLSRLAAGGASCSGRVTPLDLHLGVWAEYGGIPNPSADGSLLHGNCSGLAAAVAADLADVGVGLASVAGVPVQAACTGLYALRPSPGACEMQGITRLGGELDAPSFVSQTPEGLEAVAKALQLPGGSYMRDHLLNLVLCKDLFMHCDGAVQVARQALLAATYTWPGPEYVFHHPLLEFLTSRVPSAAKLFQGESGPWAVLEAIRHAALALQYAEFAKAHQHRLADKDSLPPLVQQQLEHGTQVGADENILGAAKRVQAELTAALRVLLKHGNILVLPTLPSPPLSAGEPEEMHATFEGISMQFGALAALAGVPQVVIPVEVPGHGPLGISLLGLPKSDAALVMAAAKLGPLIADNIVALGQKASAEEQQQGQPPQHTDVEQRAEQAAHAKAQGNAALKKQQYSEAIQHYSHAIELEGSNPAHSNNRALAFLKMGDFGRAVEDCDRVLSMKRDTKALLRRGMALAALGELARAKDDFVHVLSVEPNNRQAKDELKQLQQRVQDLDPHEPSSNGLPASGNSLPPPQPVPAGNFM